MSEHSINLNCANCGAKLDVYDDMEHFSCGYCGTELIVQRRGGTVALKMVTEAIQKVQIGTDRTAAELALVRLNQESARIEEELEKLYPNGIKSVSFGRKGCAVILAGPLGLFGVLLIISGFQGYSGLLPGLLMVIGSLIWFISAWTKPTSDKIALVEKQILERQAQLVEVKSRIVEQRRIVDSTNPDSL
jgi:hypothetical protein